jgi:hypothetical protein
LAKTLLRTQASCSHDLQHPHCSHTSVVALIVVHFFHAIQVETQSEGQDYLGLHYLVVSSEDRVQENFPESITVWGTILYVTCSGEKQLEATRI